MRARSLGIAIALIASVTCKRNETVDDRLVEVYDAELAQRIAAAVAAKGPAYKPRTRHTRPDGSAVYTNRLVLETSPYLVMHAHNPVDWYPWGEAAFAKAREQNKPVFLSIGYSTCHWCHVMEEESFEDEAIARVLNRHFVSIKVDREERPDLDSIYMTAVQQMTGSGGWPLTVFLLPDRRPFYGGTYFPPRAGVRGARVGLDELLEQLRRAYHEDRSELAERAAAIVAELARAPANGDAPDATAIRAAAAELARSFDATWGGFGRAPKFPRPAVLDLLLRHHRRTGDTKSLELVTRTLERMAAGGLYDQVGGGFHRYTVDGKWRVPHFEKMLYDNAQLATTYVDAYQVTGRADFATVARETLDYMLRDLRAPAGGFHAATDADSDGEEGTYFVWTAADIDRVVGADRGRIVREYFDVTAGGNFERGANILWRPRPLAEVAERLQLSPEQVLAAVVEARPLLLAARGKRNPPHTDTKVLVAWNALAISALARAGFVFDEPRYRDAARAAAVLLLERARAHGRLLHATGGGPAFLDDVAQLVVALLDLYEADPDPRWLREAIAHAAELDKWFTDPAGGYFFTAIDQERLLVRDKPDHDGALPAGNSVAAHALLRLYELTADDRYRARAAATLAAFGGVLARSPTALPHMLGAVDMLLDKPKQIVIASAPGTEPTDLLAKLRTTYLPNRIIVRIVDGEPAVLATAALIDGKVARGGKPTAYVCIGTQCEQPTTDPDVLAKQLQKVEPL